MPARSQTNYHPFSPPAPAALHHASTMIGGGGCNRASFQLSSLSVFLSLPASQSPRILRSGVMEFISLRGNRRSRVSGKGVVVETNVQMNQSINKQITRQGCKYRTTRRWTPPFLVPPPPQTQSNTELREMLQKPRALQSLKTITDRHELGEETGDRPREGK